MTARDWLRKNGYADVAAMIDDLVGKWKAEGKATRRNWWDVLAGGDNGKPAVICGKVFPVLRIAQRRQGKRVTRNAISRNRREQPPGVRHTGRW